MDLSKQSVAKGKLLLAEPFMLDPNFKRTVVLIVEHNESGTVGFILNKPIPVQLNDVLEDFPPFEAQLSLGGPVQNDSLHYLHKYGDELEGSIEIIPGVYWGGDFDRLQSMISTGMIEREGIRFFLGYSGWDANQLADEVNEKSWISLRPHPADILALSDDSLWNRILERNGGEYKIIAQYPEDPQLN
jgi:putative transcriptional regulator